MAEKPHERTGMVVLQAESEVASINMLYGAGATGKKAMTSSSSPGISLMQEGISYIAGAEIPVVIANVVRGGPGLGDIQPAQSDYFQTTKGGGHGDYRLIALAPSSVQEMSDFVPLAFELAFKYRNPAMIVSDGAIGQMMEKVELFDQMPRLTDEEIRAKYDWATNGKLEDGRRRIITSLDLDPYKLEKHNWKLQAKYKEIEENEVRFEKIMCDDAEYIIVAYGLSARISQKALQLLRAKGIKAGLLRPITLWPFPKKQIVELVDNGVKGFLSVEMSAGQMVEDVMLAVNGKVKVEHFGRIGGVIHSPEEVVEALEQKIIGG
jgi:2-oxoglutarate ferredoxin oxidoreductase subunit alpha